MMTAEQIKEKIEAAQFISRNVKARAIEIGDALRKEFPCNPATGLALVELGLTMLISTSEVLENAARE